ncbi:MAG: hypothetical protein M1817_005191 [Caeruleum heppii]|nr:MAG: hypothetical protein M1817_005191 [Caeruleum heppii]
MYIDAKSLEYANKNIIINNLQPRIKLLKTTPEGPLIPWEETGLESIDFVMCNPPFYSSEEEMMESAKAKKRPPFSSCTGAPVELITPGGEIAFITRLITESLHLRTRIQWYTSMLGKLSSVSLIVEKLKEAGVKNWAVTEFRVSGKTRRWGVGWSFAAWRPSAAPQSSLESISTQLNNIFTSLPRTTWRYKAALLTGIGFVAENTWSRGARRKMDHTVQEKAKSKRNETMNEDNSDSDSSDPDIDPASATLGFKIQIQPPRHPSPSGSSLTSQLDQHPPSLPRSSSSKTEPHMTIRWLKGDDQVLFESFCGMVRRRMVGGG